jgi:hypothetical protein
MAAHRVPRLVPCGAVVAKCARRPIDSHASACVLIPSVLQRQAGPLESVLFCRWG